ncbi:hypothetical protein CYMTET_18349 [Cymbomonas tetramitiformis]|uniref:Uncharacterized protein n=1 Tax=Cymbomonas tetramitiformis TaxID=36881 RepID=A0AAE0L6C5_9CHLO|nr:hypothetical protein CYMTET_18349 [Cymbomonas tetramitiformis]
MKMKQLRHKVWATACALECYYMLPYGWIINPRDKPSEQRTIAQLGEQFLDVCCREVPELKDVLPGTRAHAKEVVMQWREGKMEAIRALRMEYRADITASEEELSKWEVRRLRVEQLRTLLVTAFHKHPWVGISAVPATATFTRAQRILIQANKLLVMLAVSMLLSYNRGLGCCTAYKEHLGCHGASVDSPCHGYVTCYELYKVRDEGGFPREVYENPEMYGDPEDFQCKAFPDPNIITHRFYSIVLSIGIMSPITMLLTTLFVFGGAKLVPKHWTKRSVKSRDSGEKGGKLYGLIRNIFFLAYMVSLSQDYVGQVLVRYFVYFSNIAEAAGVILARWLLLFRQKTKTLRTSLYFINEVVFKKRDPAAVLETMAVMEEKELELHEAERDAAATFTVARSELDSVSVQLAYVLIIFVWAGTLWFLLALAMLIRNMLGDGSENEIIFRWMQAVAVDNLVIHSFNAIFLHITLQKIRERQIATQSSNAAVLEWYEDYVGKYLKTSYCHDLEDMIGEEMMTVEYER